MAEQQANDDAEDEDAQINSDHQCLFELGIQQYKQCGVDYFLSTSDEYYIDSKLQKLLIILTKRMLRIISLQIQDHSIVILL